MKHITTRAITTTASNFSPVWIPAWTLAAGTAHKSVHLLVEAAATGTVAETTSRYWHRDVRVAKVAKYTMMAQVTRTPCIFGLSRTP